MAWCAPLLGTDTDIQGEAELFQKALCDICSTASIQTELENLDILVVGGYKDDTVRVH